MEDRFRELLNSIGVLYDEQEAGSDIITCLNHYEGNGGYHHLKYNGTELVLLKGVYKDFVRVLEGKNPFTDRQLTKISEIMANVEKNCHTYFCCKFLNNEDFTVKNITELENIDRREVRLKIKRPLSAVEYNLFKDALADQNNLYSSELLGVPTKVTLPVLFCSILKKIPDVMSVIFAHSGFRVYSPSIKTILNKFFANYSTIHMAFNTFSDETLLKFFFSQARFVRQKKTNFKTPNLKFLNLSVKEAEEFINEFEQKIQNMSEESIFDGSFYETISLPFISFQIILLLFMENFSKLNEITGDYETTIKIIYKTRPTSPFYSDSKVKILHFTPEGLSFADMDLNLGENIKSVDEIIQSMPAVRRIFSRSKIEKLVKASHEILDTRDKLYFLVTDFMQRLTKLFGDISQKLVAQQKIKYHSQLYYLEIDEIKNLLNDSYYGNTQFTYFFRKWQSERFSAQIVPNEIFEKDIPSVEDIVREMVSNLMEKKTLPVLSFFHTRDFAEDFSNSTRVATIKPDFPENLKTIKDRIKVFTTNISPFSWLMEMAAISDTPVYSGVRLPDVVFEGKVLNCFKDKIDVE